MQIFKILLLIPALEVNIRVDIDVDVDVNHLSSIWFNLWMITTLCLWW